MKKQIAVVFALLVAAALFAVPTFAQSSSASKTVTVDLTEDWINSSFRVTNPPNRHITDVHVDLQPGQASISFTYTERGKNPLSMVAVFTPSIQNGYVVWTLTSLTADGKAATSDQIAKINGFLGSTWRSKAREWIRSHNPRRCPATSVTVTDTDLIVVHTCTR
jgi:hypothetical protein